MPQERPNKFAALWTNAVVEKKIVTRMNNDLIVCLPFASDPHLWRLVTENIPQSIRPLRALVLNFLLNPSKLSMRGSE